MLRSLWDVFPLYLGTHTRKPHFARPTDTPPYGYCTHPSADFSTVRFTSSHHTAHTSFHRTDHLISPTVRVTSHCTAHPLPHRMATSIGILYGNIDFDIQPKNISHMALLSPLQLSPNLLPVSALLATTIQLFGILQLA